MNVEEALKISQLQGTEIISIPSHDWDTGYRIHAKLTGKEYRKLKKRKKYARNTPKYEV